MTQEKIPFAPKLSVKDKIRLWWKWDLNAEAFRSFFISIWDFIWISLLIIAIRIIIIFDDDDEHKRWL